VLKRVSELIDMHSGPFDAHPLGQALLIQEQSYFIAIRIGQTAETSPKPKTNSVIA
jgi:hypothetical protein